MSDGIYIIQIYGILGYIEINIDEVINKTNRSITVSKKKSLIMVLPGDTKYHDNGRTANR